MPCLHNDKKLIVLIIDSSTSYNEMVNTHVSAIDAAFPGVQPVSFFKFRIHTTLLTMSKLNSD
jgi:Asp-tRNA(Asn)/Glu-tRNA(Gln) amidotransferase B subunit